MTAPLSAPARLKGKCEVTGRQESCDFCNMQIERVALETRDRIAFLEARRDELQANNLTLYHELRKERDRADARQNERDSFIPHTIVKNELGMTECVFEDVACVAKPLHPGVHHFIDELRAMDDDRLVGIQFWASRPSPGVSAPARVGSEAVDALGRPRNLSGITLAHEFASFVAGEGGDDEEEERDFGRFCQKHYAEILAALRSSAGTFEEGVEAAYAEVFRQGMAVYNSAANALSDRRAIREFIERFESRALSQKDAPK